MKLVMKMDVELTCSTAIARWYFHNSGNRYVTIILIDAWRYSLSFAVLRRMSEEEELLVNEKAIVPLLEYLKKRKWEGEKEERK